VSCLVELCRLRLAPVERDPPVEFPGRRLLDRAGPQGAAGVVNQDVQRAPGQTGPQPGEQPAEVPGHAELGSDDEGTAAGLLDRCGCLVGRGFVAAVMHGHERAVRSQALADRPADVPAGYQAAHARVTARPGAAAAADGTPG
jgi:hypothetical protein